MNAALRAKQPISVTLVPQPPPFPITTPEQQRVFAKARLMGKNEDVARVEVVRNEVRKIIRSVKLARWSKDDYHTDVGVDYDIRGVCTVGVRNTDDGSALGIGGKKFHPLPNGNFDWGAIKQALTDYLVQAGPARQRQRDRYAARAPTLALVKRLQQELSIPTDKTKSKFSFHVRDDGSLDICMGWFNADEKLVRELHAYLKGKGLV